jgi:hypothetical protein
MEKASRPGRNIFSSRKSSEIDADFLITIASARILQSIVPALNVGSIPAGNACPGEPPSMSQKSDRSQTNSCLKNWKRKAEVSA